MSINSFDIEESFFNVSSFIVYNNIYHNLNNWHIKLDNWENKAGQIELNILVPYAEMDIEITETNNDPNFFNKNTARLKININTNNTIDRYFNYKNKKFITTYPFYFDCVSTNSTIWHNKELYDSAWIVLNNLNLKHTKITNFDYTKLFNNIENFSLIKKYGSDWIDHIGSFYSIHNLFWHDVSNYIEQKNKTTCLIFGREKPNYNYHKYKKQSYTWFNDHYQTSYGNIESTNQFTKINFYNDPVKECIDILRKQLHIIQRYYLKSLIVNPDHARYWELGSSIKDKIIDRVYEFASGTPQADDITLMVLRRTL